MMLVFGCDFQVLYIAIQGPTYHCKRFSGRSSARHNGRESDQSNLLHVNFFVDFSFAFARKLDSHPGQEISPGGAHARHNER